MKNDPIFHPLSGWVKGLARESNSIGGGRGEGVAKEGGLGTGCY